MVKEEQRWETRVKGASHFADGSAIIRPTELPWTKGPFDGLSFRLSHINRQSGVWSAFFKAEPNTTIPAHYSYGQAQHYIRQGGFSFDGRELRADDYYLDLGGPVAERKVGPEGVTFYVTYDNGIGNVDADGKPTGTYMDCNYMYELAKANGAADHLSPLGR